MTRLLTMAGKWLLCVLSLSLWELQAQDRWEAWHYYINPKGEQALKVSAKSINAFSDGVAWIEKAHFDGSKSFWNYALIDTKGQLILPPHYDRTYPFKEGVAVVRKRGESKFILIDKEGKQVCSQQFDSPPLITEGMIRFEENKRYGYLNLKGEVVVPAKYVDTGGFKEGYCSVAIERDAQTWLYGFIDKTGKEVIPCVYNQAGTSSFEDGLARMRMPNGLTGFINAKNEVVVPGKYATASTYREGFYPAAFGPNHTQWGLVNKQNQVVIPGRYDDMQPVYNGIVMVALKGKYGALKTDGSVHIPLEYDEYYYKFHEDGLIVAKKGERSFVILASGKVIGQDGITPGAVNLEEEAMPFYTADRRWGLMDFDGNILLAPTYCFIGRFSSGLAPVKLCE